MNQKLRDAIHEHLSSAVEKAVREKIHDYLREQVDEVDFDELADDAINATRLTSKIKDELDDAVDTEMRRVVKDIDLESVADDYVSDECDMSEAAEDAIKARFREDIDEIMSVTASQVAQDVLGTTETRDKMRKSVIVAVEEAVRKEVDTYLDE